ncbi:MAG TPA: DUF6755 family protein [Polyangia bacterium]|nr:DUF6755 family protein [Polyangia bacterium]
MDADPRPGSKPRRAGPRAVDPRGGTAIDGANALIAILVIVQMWLVSAALESALAGRVAAALPAAIASGLLFAGCLLLFRFVTRVDREMRR